ncbi:hypothetical protein ACYX7E_15860 [Luteimonas sp. RIT-PG2_3]
MVRDFSQWLPGAALAALAAASPWLEADMARHMGIELPALFAIGWFGARSLPAGGPRWWHACNAHGLSGLVLASLVTMYWMLPVALDLAVLHPWIGASKIAGLLIAGVAAGLSWSQAPLALQGFFVLGWAWMMATIGMIYQQAPQQLCSVYLGEQQVAAGRAIVLIAMVVLVAWCWQVGARLLRASQMPECHRSCALDASGGQRAAQEGRE